MMGQSMKSNKDKYEALRLAFKKYTIRGHKKNCVLVCASNRRQTQSRLNHKGTLIDKDRSRAGLKVIWIQILK